jgi:hypothetical protein
MFWAIEFELLMSRDIVSRVELTGDTRFLASGKPDDGTGLVLEIFVTKGSSSKGLATSSSPT